MHSPFCGDRAVPDDKSSLTLGTASTFPTDLPVSAPAVWETVKEGGIGYSPCKCCQSHPSHPHSTSFSVLLPTQKCCWFFRCLHLRSLCPPQSLPYLVLANHISSTGEHVRPPATALIALLCLLVVSVSTTDPGSSAWVLILPPAEHVFQQWNLLVSIDLEDIFFIRYSNLQGVPVLLQLMNFVCSLSSFLYPTPRVGYRILTLFTYMCHSMHQCNDF